ncbi:hypothetical protein D4R75_08940 [bacterium]|nr:MAG: hypothetical protein D4R75_08940 [bacterium]
MKNHLQPYQTGFFLLSFLFLLFTVEGCKKDDSSTGPVVSPTYLSLAGHWVGGGSYFDMGYGKRLTISWICDFVTRTQNTFAGNRTGTNTTVGSGLGGKTIWSSRGSVTTSGQVTITDTSGVFVSAAGQSTPIDARLIGTWGPCILSANGDTLSYSGPSPETEVFVLVKQH